MTLIATITLAAAALFRSLSDFRMGAWIIVSGASATLVPSLSAGKRVSMLLVLGVVGVFTLFHWNQFSRAPISMLDMATLTVLAVSPIILANTRPLVLKHPAAKL